MQDNPDNPLAQAAVGGSLVLLLWSVWRWIDILSSYPAAGAGLERQARVVDLVVLTIGAAVALTGTMRLALPRKRRADSVIGRPPKAYAGGPVIEMVDSEPISLRPVTVASPTAVSSMAMTNVVAERHGRREPEAVSAQPGRGPLGTEESVWIKEAMEKLAHELTLVNGYSDLLLASAGGAQENELRMIRCSGERSSLLVQQFFVFDERHRIELAQVNLNALVEIVRPKVMAVVSRETRLGFALHSQQVNVKGDAATLALLVCSLVADLGRGCGENSSIVVSTGSHSITVEGSAISKEAKTSSSPALRTAARVAGLLGGEFTAKEARGGKIRYRLSLPAADERR